MYVQIETINYCNRKCKFCFLGHYNAPAPKNMSLSLFEHILQELTNIDEEVQIMAFSSYSEPTLDPYFIKRMELLKKYYFTYWNFSNGTNLNKDIADYFFDNWDLTVRSLIIDLPAIDPEEYSDITGGDRKQLEKTKKNLHYLGKRIRKDNVNALIVVLGWEDEKHEKNYQEVKKEFEQYGYKIQKLTVEDRAGQLRPFIDNKWFIKNPTQCLNMDRMNSFLHFGVQGNLYMCCCDFRQRFTYGDITKQPLRDILQSQKRKDMHQAMKGSLCRNCLHAR